MILMFFGGQFSKAVLWIWVTVFGTARVSKSQDKKAYLSIFATVFGISTVSSEVHNLNVANSISVTPSGIDTRFNEVQLLKALRPIFVTVFGISTLSSA